MYGYTQQVRLDLSFQHRVEGERIAFSQVISHDPFEKEPDRELDIAPETNFTISKVDDIVVGPDKRPQHFPCLLKFSDSPFDGGYVEYYGRPNAATKVAISVRCKAAHIKIHRQNADSGLINVEDVLTTLVSGVTINLEGLEPGMQIVLTSADFRENLTDPIDISRFTAGAVIVGETGRRDEQCSQIVPGEQVPAL